MRQFLMSGSVRGAARKGCPYRDFRQNLQMKTLRFRRGEGFGKLLQNQRPP